LLVERERVLVAFDVVHLDAADDIARLTERLLREADANGRFPRPVEDIIAAANLVEPRTRYSPRKRSGTRRRTYAMRCGRSATRSTPCSTARRGRRRAETSRASAVVGV
jgi:hypothetical protein